MNDNHDATGRFASGQGPNGAKTQGNEHHDDKKVVDSVMREFKKHGVTEDRMEYDVEMLQHNAGITRSQAEGVHARLHERDPRMARAQAIDNGAASGGRYPPLKRK